MSVGLLTEVSMMILVSFIDSKPITKFRVGSLPMWEVGGFQTNYFNSTVVRVLTIGW